MPGGTLIQVQIFQEEISPFRRMGDKDSDSDEEPQAFSWNMLIDKSWKHPMDYTDMRKPDAFASLRLKNLVSTTQKSYRIWYI